MWVPGPTGTGFPAQGPETEAPSPKHGLEFFPQGSKYPDMRHILQTMITIPNRPTMYTHNLLGVWDPKSLALSKGSI